MPASIVHEKRKGMVATMPKAVDAQANRLLGLLSFKDYRRL